MLYGKRFYAVLGSVKIYVHKFKVGLWGVLKRLGTAFFLCFQKCERGVGKMKYGYARVSTKGQLDGNSIGEQTNAILSLYADAEIIVESYSGAKERPLFNRMLEQAQENDYVIVTKLDRFCRSTKEGLGYIDLLMNKGVKIHILNMGLIENTPMGRLIVTNLLAFAEFERAMIIERTQGGRAVARQNPDYKEGRPPKYGRKKISHALELLETYSYKQVSEMTGISRSTLVRAKRGQKAGKTASMG